MNVNRFVGDGDELVMLGLDGEPLTTEDRERIAEYEAGWEVKPGKDQDGIMEAGGSSGDAARKAWLNRQRATAKPAAPKVVTKGTKETGLKLVKAPSRVFAGKSVETAERLSKQQAGALGENIVLEYLHMTGFKDAAHVNEKQKNFPVDAFQDHSLIEIKTGQVSNGESAQHWRATIGEPGEEEKAWLRTATPEEKRLHNEQKAQAIIDRKWAALKAYTKATGQKVTGRTYTVILNPDAHTADVFHFPGFHSRIAWDSRQAAKGYVGTFRYAARTAKTG